MLLAMYYLKPFAVNFIDDVYILFNEGAQNFFLLLDCLFQERPHEKKSLIAVALIGAFTAPAAVQIAMAADSCAGWSAHLYW